jgi:hypothetical protein
MTRLLWLIPCLTTFALAGPARADADTARRSGFTLELGVGMSHTYVDPDAAGTQNELGLAPLSISLGSFVTDRIAVLGRIAGTSYFEQVDGETEQFTSGFLGVVGEYWFSDRWFASAGIGLAGFGANPLLSEREVDIEQGVGLSLRGGYSFLTSTRHSLRAAIELFPSVYGDATTLGTALNLEWQLF